MIIWSLSAQQENDFWMKDISDVRATVDIMWWIFLTLEDSSYFSIELESNSCWCSGRFTSVVSIAWSNMLDQVELQTNMCRESVSVQSINGISRSHRVQDSVSLRRPSRSRADYPVSPISLRPCKIGHRSKQEMEPSTFYPLLMLSILSLWTTTRGARDPTARTLSCTRKGIEIHESPPASSEQSTTLLQIRRGRQSVGPIIMDVNVNPDFITKAADDDQASRLVDSRRSPSAIRFGDVPLHYHLHDDDERVDGHRQVAQEWRRSLLPYKILDYRVETESQKTCKHIKWEVEIPNDDWDRKASQTFHNKINRDLDFQSSLTSQSSSM